MSVESFFWACEEQDQNETNELNMSDVRISEGNSTGAKSGSRSVVGENDEFSTTKLNNGDVRVLEQKRIFGRNEIPGSEQMKPTEVEPRKAELCEREENPRHSTGALVRGSDGKKSGRQVQKTCHPESKIQDGYSYCHSETIIDGTKSEGLEVQNLPKFKATLKQVQSDMKFDKKYAFTLAETLITLVIVGVVAALTIPNLIVKYQKEQTVSKLKKLYSTLAQATDRAIADNGPIDTWDIDLSDDKFIKKCVLPYLSTVNNSNINQKNNKDYKYLKGEQHSFSNMQKIILNDGTSIVYGQQRNGPTPGYTIAQGKFYVDINGDKKPNTLGKDIFILTYNFVHPDKNQQGKFLPYGNNMSRSVMIASWNNDACHKSRPGYSCAALIMKDGWKISDDYPW